MEDKTANATGSASLQAFIEEHFDASLDDLADSEGVEALMAIPGVYELVREHLNNEVIDACRERWCDELGLIEARSLRGDVE